MILYAQIVNDKTMQCNVGTGTNEDFYKSIGMEKMDVEEAWDGTWYKSGFAPTKPASVEKEEKIQELKAQLTVIDEKSNRSMRAILAGTATEADRTFLANLEAQAEELRQQIHNLGGIL